MRKTLAAALFALFAFVGQVNAQSISPVILPGGCGTGAAGAGSLAYLTVDSTLKLCTAASVSASITGFPTVQSTGTPISVTTGGVTGTLPAGTVVVTSNVGATNGAYCKLGASATTSDQLIPPNSWFSFTVGANTQLTCITSTSTTTVNMVGGSGIPTGSGGGGGGSGGGAVTIAAGADVTTGNTTDGACAGDATSGCTVESRLIRIAQNQTNQLNAIQASIPAGTNTIGTVGQLPYPVGAVPLTASATGTTAATTATLAGAVGKTTYLCSYSIRANATAATTVQNTITGVITATLTHQMWVAPAASGLGVDEQIFNPCVPASATNTGIAVVSGAPGAGGLVSATATGYQL